MDERSVVAAVWLFAVAAVVLAMVVVGGATRLTGSGLSITQWNPIVGAIPPLNPQAWAHAFDLYRATPQYRLVNRGMSLGEFQFIFWWEWSHRLLGRLLGVVFFVPFVGLLLMRRLPRRLIWRCAALFCLGGLQGAVGWWMVKSGLEARVSVAPERLATHLGLALILFVSLIWTGLEAWRGPTPAGEGRRDGWAWASTAFALGVFLQCLLGALVAGNKAGLIDNDWPLMAGRFVPDDYWARGLWSTLAHNASAVQFNHRLLAYALLAAGWTMAILALGGRATRSSLRPLALAVAGLLTLQVMLGIGTLVWGVPLAMALAHQATAALLLAMAAAFAWHARRI
jgi:heme a synthase